jgi:hypothetical protein
MARAGLRRVILGLAALGLLMGCVEGGSQGSGEGMKIASPAKKAGGSRDVEAPELFDTTDAALWDGRPSLGGIWVASPEVTDPQRVIMVNPATGVTVTGALFRRERDNPGPRLQLSSDAAEALGILAGQPTEIKVTALRKESDVAEAPAAEEPEATETEATEAEAAPAEGAAETDEAAAIASAALAAVEADGATAPEAASDGASADGTAAAPEDAAAAAVDTTPKKKTWKERRAEAKAAREAKRRAAAEAKAAEKAAAAAAAGEVAGTAAEAATATAETAAATAIESAPLDARKPDVSSAADEASEKVATEEPAAAAPAPAEATPEAAPEPVPAPIVASGPARPIQVASFSKEDNAKRAAEALAKIGITATPQKSDQGGKAVWGVVVMGDDAMLKKIKDAGFADAYYLK